MKQRSDSSTAPTDLLAGRYDLDGDIEARPHLWGFGGFHGGLALALAAMRMADDRDLGTLRSVTGHFLRPLRGNLRIETERVRSGRTATTVAATVHADDRRGVRAVATFGEAGALVDGTGPIAPDAGVPLDHATFAPPPEFVPVSVFTEIRPVGPNLPFLGGDDPELSAWIRLTGDEARVDVPRLIMLADALAPSYAAVLTDLVLIPTVELTVRPTSSLGASSSPWVLLRARSDVASEDGWINERIDLWDLEGRHLGLADQLRVVSSR